MSMFCLEVDWSVVYDVVRGRTREAVVLEGYGIMPRELGENIVGVVNISARMSALYLS